MGTRALTILNDNDGDEIAVLYRQMDGYPSGHGEELAAFLRGFTVVNGLGVDRAKKVANGGSCLAAQIIAHFKTEAGQFYLHPPGTRDCWEDFRYTVVPKKGAIDLTIEAVMYGIPPPVKKPTAEQMSAAVVESLASEDNNKYWLPIFAGPVDKFDVGNVDARLKRAYKAAEKRTAKAKQQSAA
jgi:hypothetical protein